MASTDLEKSLAYQEPLTQSAPNGLDEIRQSASDKHLDDNYALYKSARDLEATPEEIKAVLRKIDFRIIPILFVTYMLQYLDKNSINFSSVYGLQAGTHLNPKSQQYSWLGMFTSLLLKAYMIYDLTPLGSIFYFGYLGAQFPAGYFLQRLPIGKFLSYSTIAWGIILITTPACVNFGGIAANRFLLGALEAIVNPGFVSDLIAERSRTVLLTAVLGSVDVYVVVSITSILNP
jgi:hypothetical protein